MCGNSQPYSCLWGRWPPPEASVASCQHPGCPGCPQHSFQCTSLKTLLRATSHSRTRQDRDERNSTLRNLRALWIMAIVLPQLSTCTFGSPNISIIESCPADSWGGGISRLGVYLGSITQVTPYAGASDNCPSTDCSSRPRAGPSNRKISAIVQGWVARREDVAGAFGPVSTR